MNAIMRIALMTISYDDHTGIGRIVRSLSSRFIKSGHSVCVMAQAFSDVVDGTRVQKLVSLASWASLNKVMFRLQTGGFKRSGEFDVVNSFGVGGGANVVTAQSCHRAGMERLRQYRQSHIWRRNLGLYDRVSLGDERRLLTSQSTKRIIAVSRAVKQEIVDAYALPADKIDVVPNGVDLERFAPNAESRVVRQSWRKRLGIGETDVVLLFVGNEFDRKGLQTIIEAISLLKDPRPRLLVVGSDDATDFSAYARRLGVVDRILFVGTLSGPERIYAAADVFVFPSLYEPFGIVVLEAMAAGLPVIASRLCGAVETFEHDRECWLLDNPASADELVVALEKVLHDQERFRRLSRQGKVAAMAFDWGGIAEQTLGVYSKVLSQEA